MTIPAKVRSALRRRADDCCEKCGLRYANNAHHRKNLSQGGEDTLSNLMLLCGSGTTGCHGWITEHPKESYREGWSVRRGDDPASKRVLYRGTYVMLDDLGALEDAA